MKEDLYCAIIGDINKSRTLRQRGRIQQRFHHAISVINKEFKKEIASQFVLTLGDEFQGLLRSPAESYRLICRFRDLMEPVPFAFGVGIGALATELRRSAIGMDGECFYRARGALERAKKNKQQLVYDFEGSHALLANALIALLEKDWTLLNPTQRKIEQLMKLYNRQQTVARRLGITQQYVSKTIRTTTLKEMREAENALYEFLKGFSTPFVQKPSRFVQR